MTVNDLSKQLRCRPKAILEALLDLNILPDTQFPNHTVLTEDEEDRVREFISSKSTVIGLAKSVAARFGEEI